MHNQRAATTALIYTNPKQHHPQNRISFSNSCKILAKIAPTPPIPEVSAYRFLVIASESAHNAELHTHTHTHRPHPDPSASAAKHFVWRIGEREHLRVASKYHAHHLCRHPFSPPARKRHPRGLSVLFCNPPVPRNPAHDPLLGSDTPPPGRPRPPARRVKKTAVSRTWGRGVDCICVRLKVRVCGDVRGRRMSPVDRKALLRGLGMMCDCCSLGFVFVTREVGQTKFN